MFNFLDWFIARGDLFLSFDFISFVLFIALLTVYLIKTRKDLDVQNIIGFKDKEKNLPIMYMALYRKKWGISFINKFADKNKKLIKSFGYFSIFLGILGMITIVSMVVYMAVMLINQPFMKGGAALVLPFTNVPGVGYLSFWYWIICLTSIILIHEFSHAIVARAHGIRIKNTGIGVFGIILPVIPVAFVEPDENQMKKKKHLVRHSVLSAGPSINIIAALFSFILLILFPMFVMEPFINSNAEQGAFTFQVDEQNETLPSIKAGLEDDFVVTTFNGNKVESFYDIDLTVIDPGDDIIFGGYKKGEGEYEEYTIKTINHPDNNTKPFIGIVSVTDTYKYQEGSLFYAESLQWIYFLIVWMYVLQIAIGLMNLLPIGITDGGQMLILFFDKVIKKAKVRNILMTVIITFFAFVLFASLFLNYFGGYISKLLS